MFDYLLSFFFFFGEKKPITTCRGDKKFTRVKITCTAQLDNAKHGVYCAGGPAGPPDPPPPNSIPCVKFKKQQQVLNKTCGHTATKSWCVGIFKVKRRSALLIGRLSPKHTSNTCYWCVFFRRVNQSNSMDFYLKFFKSFQIVSNRFKSFQNVQRGGGGGGGGGEK